MANAPAHASDDTINALAELVPPILSRVPVEDWHIDIDDDGAMTGKCPRCGCSDISAITPEWLACLGCGHREGEPMRYEPFTGITAGVEPPDYRPAPRVYEDEE